jgi:alkanesulfonate monooxygenase
MSSARLRVFPAIPRNPNAAQHIEDLMRVARFAEARGLDGPLLFAGNDTPVEPWAMAQHILARTETIFPLIAVNPLYMPPFTVAKFVSSFAQLYRRRICLNMITGTANSDLEGLGDQQAHDKRYSRLGEFIRIVSQLLASARPVTFRGEFYEVASLQLRPGLPPALMPEFLIAGRSDNARRVAAQTGCLRMQMLPRDLEQRISAPGLNFGKLAASVFDIPGGLSVPRRQLCGDRRDLARSADMKIDTIIPDVAWERELDRVCKALAPSGVF